MKKHHQQTPTKIALTLGTAGVLAFSNIENVQGQEEWSVIRRGHGIHGPYEVRSQFTHFEKPNMGINSQYFAKVSANIGRFTPFLQAKLERAHSDIRIEKNSRVIVLEPVEWREREEGNGYSAGGGSMLDFLSAGVDFRVVGGLNVRLAYGNMTGLSFGLNKRLQLGDRTRLKFYTDISNQERNRYVSSSIAQFFHHGDGNASVLHSATHTERHVSKFTKANAGMRLNFNVRNNWDLVLGASVSRKFNVSLGNDIIVHHLDEDKLAPGLEGFASMPSPEILNHFNLSLGVQKNFRIREEEQRVRMPHRQMARPMGRPAHRVAPSTFNHPTLPPRTR